MSDYCSVMPINYYYSINRLCDNNNNNNNNNKK